MTEQEAIEVIKRVYNVSCPDHEDEMLYEKAIELAIKALERQIAKEVKFKPWMNTECDCGFVFSVHHGDGYHSIPYENQTKYCTNCGQKLDWDVIRFFNR